MSDAYWLYYRQLARQPADYSASCSQLIGENYTGKNDFLGWVLHQRGSFSSVQDNVFIGKVIEAAWPSYRYFYL
ncbi:MAG: hypothetical protein WC208_01805 [Gallionella sp.]